MEPGSHIKRMFSGMLANADKTCLCHPRACLMDLWGPRLCKTNIESIIDWVEEEADKQGLTEDPAFVAKTTKYLTRYLGLKYRLLRPFPEVRWYIAQWLVRRKGYSRRVAIRRIVLICIERAKRGKQP